MNQRNKHHALTLAIIGSMSTVPSLTYAQETEIETLKKEVKELRILLESNIQNSNTIQNQLKQQITTQSEKPKNDKPIYYTKSGAQFELYGILRADAIYQVNGAEAIYNNINKVPLEHTTDAKKQGDTLKGTVNVTRFGLNFSNPALNHNIGGKLEVDFFGGATRDQFRIRHAYLTYDKWLFGQTWSTFIAPEYTPESIDAGTFVGGSVQRSPMVKYSDNINSSNKFAISIEDPKYTATTDPEGKTKFPILAGKITHYFDDAEIAGRSFITKKATAEDELFSWGVGLGGKYQFTPNIQLKADYYHVKGDGKLINWTNASYVIDTNNKMHANEFDSITAGLGVRFNPKFRTNFGFGFMQAKDNNEFSKIHLTTADQNKSLWQSWANVLYSPIQPITLGAEIVYGERKTFSDLKGKDNRLNFMATYEF